MFKVFSDVLTVYVKKNLIDVCYQTPLLSLHKIYSNRETIFLNQNSLNTLSHLTELAFHNTKDFLGASFSPSLLKYLFIGNLLNQKSTVNTNITQVQK